MEIKAVEFVGLEINPVYIAKANGRVYKVPGNGSTWYGNRKITVIGRRLKQFDNNSWHLNKPGIANVLTPDEIAALPDNKLPEFEAI
jgi:hypothetical protein